MITLTVPSHLSALLLNDDLETKASRASRVGVLLSLGAWPELVLELRDRFPRLADHVFTEAGKINHGFVLVVNDEIILDDYSSLVFHDGDELCIVAAIAGG